MWAPPVILAVEAAPAFAASVGPLTVTATRVGLAGTTVRLTFSGGDTAYTVSISSVTYQALGTFSVAMVPTTGISSTGGTSDGVLGAPVIGGRTYTVTYTFNGATYIANPVLT